jgi:hypothetical protein
MQPVILCAQVCRHVVQMAHGKVAIACSSEPGSLPSALMLACVASLAMRSTSLINGSSALKSFNGRDGERGERNGAGPRRRGVMWS